MYDLLGRHIQSLYNGLLLKTQSYSFEVETGGLPAGVYFVRIEGEKNLQTHAFTLLEKR